MGGNSSDMGKSNRQPECLIISGIDGSGKSTVIEALKKTLEARGLKVGCIWLRFNHYLTKGMHALARILGLSVRITNEMGTVWQHRFYQSRAFCKLYILATYADTRISRWKYDRAAKGRDTVICDRWVPDILVDLATKTHDPGFLDGKWVSRFLNILPRGARMFVVTRNTSALYDCRLENRVDPDFPLRLECYGKLCTKPFVHIVDNNGSIENSIKQIL